MKVISFECDSNRLAQTGYRDACASGPFETVVSAYVCSLRVGRMADSKEIRYCHWDLPREIWVSMNLWRAFSRSIDVGLTRLDDFVEGPTQFVKKV